MVPDRTGNAVSGGVMGSGVSIQGVGFVPGPFIQLDWTYDIIGWASEGQRRCRREAKRSV